MVRPLLTHEEILALGFVKNEDTEELIGWKTKYVKAIPNSNTNCYIALSEYGGQYWFHGQTIHREDGPAYINYCVEEWYFGGYVHRYDGPASLEYNGEFDKERWYIHGRPIDVNYYKIWLLEMGMDINNLTPEDKVLIDLKWKKP